MTPNSTVHCLLYVYNTIIINTRLYDYKTTSTEWHELIVQSNFSSTQVQL